MHLSFALHEEGYITATKDGHTILAIRSFPTDNKDHITTNENTLEFTITTSTGQSILLDSTGMISIKGPECSRQKYPRHVQEGIDHSSLTQDTGEMKLGKCETRFVLPDGTQIRKMGTTDIQIFLANGDMALRPKAAQSDDAINGWTNISANGDR